MKRSLLLALAVTASLSLTPFFGARAADATLTGTVVKQFIETLPDLKTFSDEMQKSGKDDTLEKAFSANSASMGADFSPYSAGVAALKDKFPADYANLAGIVAKHGFSSAETWAAAGNEVIKSYMAIKMEGVSPEGAAAMQNLSPEILAKMPPEAREQIERSKKMMASAAAVPASEKDAFRPYMGAFEEWAQKAAAEHNATAGAANVPKVVDTDAKKAAIEGAINSMMQKQK